MLEYDFEPIWGKQICGLGWEKVNAFEKPLQEKNLIFSSFLNLPLWANFYIYTDLSGTTTTTLDQPTLLDDINLNPQPQPSTRLAQQHRLRRVEAEVEAEVEAG